ncbi:hypothetical protein [Burkholderia contaminans]|uniref:hypothetical protein n=1 Tax=Burkholderia contaminans TaxID=488447 RepID=UPI00145388CF|nr:hypothetical protein [Burkholderia contaminans]VWD22543.1 hypothetical protein BCO18442_04029 [Burkholderia contaminans]
MEQVWEYQWEFIDTPYTGPPKQTGFWMTDYEAERWHGYGKEGTRRLDETRRDRKAQPPIPTGGGTIGDAYAGPDTNKPLPAFTSPDLAKLRYWWMFPYYCSHHDIRVLILEVVRQRRKLDSRDK